MIWVIRWYPDKGCDLFRDEFADYANEEIMQRLMMRAYARNADVAFTGTRGITKTSTKFKYAMLNGLVWPGKQAIQADRARLSGIGKGMARDG